MGWAVMAPRDTEWYNTSNRLSHCGHARNDGGEHSAEGGEVLIEWLDRVSRASSKRLSRICVWTQVQGGIHIWQPQKFIFCYPLRPCRVQVAHDFGVFLCFWELPSSPNTVNVICVWLPSDMPKTLKDRFSDRVLKVIKQNHTTNPSTFLKYLCMLEKNNFP